MQAPLPVETAGEGAYGVAAAFPRTLRRHHLQYAVHGMPGLQATAAVNPTKHASHGGNS